MLGIEKMKYKVITFVVLLFILGIVYISTTKKSPVETQVVLTDEKDYDLLISKATAYAFRGIQPSEDELISAEAAYKSLEKEKDKVAEWIYSTLQTKTKKTPMAYGYILWRFGPDYVKGLEPSVLKSSHENTRLNGVYILGTGNKYHKSIIDLTINVLIRDPSPKVKAEAIHSLNALRAADDFTVIIPYLDSKDAMVRKAAVQFFWSYPQEEAIKALRQMLETEENTIIREWIEKAISKYERYKNFPSD
jgi:HEAT repeat protein